MEIMVYSLLWVKQDLYHQPYVYVSFLAGNLYFKGQRKPPIDRNEFNIGALVITCTILGVP